MPISIDHLLSSFDLSFSDILNYLLEWDRKGLFQRVVEKIRQPLRATACHLYLSADGGEFEVAAGHPNFDVPNWKEWLSGRFWLKQVFESMQPQRQRLDKVSPSTSSPAEVLVVPLLHRDRCLGVLEIERNQGADPSSSFSDLDEEFATSIVKILSAGVYLFGTGDLARKVFVELREAASLEAFHRILVNAAMGFVQADRGDLAIWDPATQSLVVRSSVGDTELQQGLIVDRQCVLSVVWEKKKDKRLSNVHLEGAGYWEVDPNVRSELAVCWTIDDHPSGVLNLESYNVNHFTDADGLLLRVLCQGAAFAYPVLGKQIQLDNIYARLFKSTPAPNEILQTILESVVEFDRFEAGLIYALCDDQSRLECVASIGKEEGNGFGYALEEDSLATHVFRNGRGQFCNTPNDPLVNRTGVEKFGIRGPIAAVPLVMSEQSEIVGTLVVWNNSQSNSLKEHHLKNLRPFARVAAAQLIQTKTAQQRKLTVEQYQELHSKILNETDLETNLLTITEGIQKLAGFDRVRIYDYRKSTERFECRRWVGMGEEFRGHSISLEKTRYASDIFMNGKIDPRVRIYDPKKHKIGLDPDAEALGKPEDLEWAVLPLRNNGTVCGQIAADNALSKRKISQENLDALTLLGGLASQAIANDAVQFESKMRTTFRVLLDKFKQNVPPNMVNRWLLVYATCKESLSFSRALFLEKKDAIDRLEYSSGLGSLTYERHAHIINVATGTPLPELLDKAWDWKDRDLDTALENFGVAGDTVKSEGLMGAPGVKHYQALDHASWPTWVNDLATRIGATELLVARVGDENDFFGLLVVDRQWQRRDLSTADSRVMEVFAQQTATLILRQYALSQQIQESERLSSFGFVVEALAHDIRQPVGSLRIENGTFREDIEEGDFGSALETSLRMETPLQQIVDTVRDLELFVKPEGGYKDLDLHPFVQEILDGIRERAEKAGTTLLNDISSDLSRVRLIPQLLRRALVNLLSNSLEAMKRNQTSGTVRVQVRKVSDTRVEVVVLDTGPGIPKSNLEKVRREGKAFTSKPGQGLGLGLEIVRRVAEAHNQGTRKGSIVIESEERRGTTVTLSLPVVN